MRGVCVCVVRVCLFSLVSSTRKVEASEVLEEVWVCDARVACGDLCQEDVSAVVAT